MKQPFDPSEYFLTLPHLGTGSKFGDLEYDTSNLFSQITIDNNILDANANITQGIEQIDDSTVHFLFDIDVVKKGVFDESKMWEDFEQLHKFKNEIFF